MNIYIIDSDCRKYFPDEDAVRNQLQDSECKVVFWTPGQSVELGTQCRCILISAMSSGVKKQHHELLYNNPDVASWIITVVDVSLKGEQNQLTENIDAILMKCKVPYTIVFEDVSLTETARLCAIPVKTKKLCLVRSCDEALALELAQMLAHRLPQWSIQTLGDDYDQANVILLAGSTVEDFQIPAPKYGMGRTRVWIRQTYPRKQNNRASICRCLEDNGWSIPGENRIYESNLTLETYAYGMEIGDIDNTTLANDEKFVLCDRYGLPLLSKDYTSERVGEVLADFCCLKEMTAGF